MDWFEGLRWGAVASAFGLGLRHGFDWDHVAAITDITSSQDPDRAGTPEAGRRSLLLSTLYILGHGLVVTALGLVAIAAGSTIPSWLDGAMGRVIGATLVALGVYVLVSLVRHGRQARMRSRWMLALAGFRRLVRWVRQAPGGEPVVIDHEHDHEPAHHDTVHPPVVPAAGPAVAPAAEPEAAARRHRHRHHHVGHLPDDPFVEYGRGMAFLVGMLHGVGAETPTQMVLFATAAGATSAWVGSVFLIAFVGALMISNTVVALASRAGVFSASRNYAAYATVSVVVAALSLYLGVVYLFALGDGLPAIFG